MSQDTYENPLVTRYASRAMAGLWSSQTKFSTWRRLWVALAEAEGHTRIFSIDEDFYIYRLADGTALEVLPGPKTTKRGRL